LAPRIIYLLLPIIETADASTWLTTKYADASTWLTT
jgi:hypothetical protein